ncbi:hypothetical protein F0562_027622 [Nyssa sinensis]|uniref:Uncharacterized protein n=1 Tax=Nyssa sinensis TaxID=561372 RepID=A0A5J5B586_9ASTE|nr:hypothetical protein F0562_027622 [Nyssa sinensis]
MAQSLRSRRACGALRCLLGVVQSFKGKNSLVITMSVDEKEELAENSHSSIRLGRRTDIDANKARGCGVGLGPGNGNGMAFANLEFGPLL